MFASKRLRKPSWIKHGSNHLLTNFRTNNGFCLIVRSHVRQWALDDHKEKFSKFTKNEKVQKQNQKKSRRITTGTQKGKAEPRIHQQRGRTTLKRLGRRSLEPVLSAREPPPKQKSSRGPQIDYIYIERERETHEFVGSMRTTDFKKVHGANTMKGEYRALSSI